MVDSVAKRAGVLVALGLAASTACGGISQRNVGDDNESGSGGDGASGGNPTGGRGGKGGVGADGGSFTTGGSDDGGSTFTGGVGGAVGGTGAVGGSFTGGSGAVGGSFTGGTGGVGVGGSMPVAGAASGGAASNPYAIPWDFSGYVAPERNILGLAGGLYFSNDCRINDGTLPCTERDPKLVGPDGEYGWAVSEVVACARGTAPQVVADPSTGEPAYQLQWGALLGIAMYQPEDSVFDATAHGIAGFTVDIVGVAPADLRINLVTPETIGVSHFITVILPTSTQTILFTDVLQGNWVSGPVPFDPTRLSSIEFHVYTNATSPKPFDFCITNLQAVPL
jgi:hypothetical protein